MITKRLKTKVKKNIIPWDVSYSIEKSVDEAITSTKDCGVASMLLLYGGFTIGTWLDRPIEGLIVGGITALLPLVYHPIRHVLHVEKLSKNRPDFAERILEYDKEYRKRVFG